MKATDFFSKILRVPEGLKMALIAITNSSLFFGGGA